MRRSQDRVWSAAGERFERGISRLIGGWPVAIAKASLASWSDAALPKITGEQRHQGIDVCFRDVVRAIHLIAPIMV